MTKKICIQDTKRKKSGINLRKKLSRVFNHSKAYCWILTTELRRRIHTKKIKKATQKSETLLANQQHETNRNLMWTRVFWNKLLTATTRSSQAPSPISESPNKKFKHRLITLHGLSNSDFQLSRHWKSQNLNLPPIKEKARQAITKDLSWEKIFCGMKLSIQSPQLTKN